MTSVEKRLFGKVWLHAGVNIRRFALGFSIDRFGIDLDIGPFWFNIEYWGLFHE
jgi:hypothetical protein